MNDGDKALVDERIAQYGKFVAGLKSSTPQDAILDFVQNALFKDASREVRRAIFQEILAKQEEPDLDTTIRKQEDQRVLR